MSKLREAAQQAKQTPLIDLLERVPENARLRIDEPDGLGSTNIPAGRLCRDAAAALRAANPPVWEQYVVFEDNNGALRKRPEDCQAFGANGQPAAVYVGRQRYVPEPVQTPCDIAEDGVCEVIDCCRNPTQEEPKPVAWRYKGMMGMPWSLSDDGYYASCKRDNGYMVEPLYTHPPRQWRGLSKDESLKLWGTRSDGPSNSEIIGFARAIEQALKEKNA